ncbi:hypothetical protein INR49_007543 [Caranx melampygus]|nr:hypothetical protein INR49_007543 [Caranx melampygus]
MDGGAGNKGASDGSNPHTPRTPTSPLPPTTPTRRTELYALIDIERTAAMSNLQKARPRDDGTSRKTRHNSTELPTKSTAGNSDFQSPGGSREQEDQGLLQCDGDTIAQGVGLGALSGTPAW